MRKDVKLGLAVGGVLLAVLVVYVLVVPGTNPNQPGAHLENLDGSEIQSPEADSAGAGALAYGTPGADTSTEGQSSSGAADQRPGSTGGGASADAGTTNGGSDRTNTGNGENPSGESAGSESAGGGWNWDALVAGTEKVPSLAAGTDVPTNGALAAGAGTADGSAADGSSNNGSSAGNGTLQNGVAPAGNGNAAANDSSTLSDNSDTASSGNSPSASDTLGDATAASSSQSPARQNGLAGGAQTNIDGQPAASGTGVRTHVVKIGDTYSKISLAAYGTSKHYAQIEHANPGVDPTRLKPGQTLTLPAIATKPAAASSTATQAVLDPQKEYKVQPNDSLHTISLRLYGKADRVEKIYELNKATIGNDMARVKIGTVLKLPEPPTQSSVAASSR